MRRVSTLLVSTSVLVLLGSPAWAKAQPVPPPDPAATAQQNPAQPVQNADAPADGSSIVVTGLRRALQSARNIKRNSDQVVDAVVAEDIGKLPDITVSDTAARIPGIQVERSGGEATRVLLRGLDNVYYTTT
ncbi:MAG: iron complex outerrane recepter protein, partial [Sphingomonadales bacterium]|nr:iron complex outerrane recepter protein [Sphingomonadales bacterium]